MNNKFRYYPMGYPLLQAIIDDMGKLYNLGTVLVGTLNENDVMVYSREWVNKDAEKNFHELQELFHIENQRVIESYARTYRHFAST